MQNTLKPGTKLCSGKYRIDSVIGQGGFGITYRATYFREIKEALGSIIAEVPVAMKEYFFADYCDRSEDSFTVSVTNSQIRMFEDFKRKLIKEAHIISGLQHPNIVSVLDVFEENNTAYVVMYFIQGLSLKEIIEKKGKLAEKDALKYITHIAQALDTVHRQNVLHLDIKPGNILIETATDKAFLIDFGASKRYDSASHEETSTTPAAKSKGYAPPEQYLDGGVSLFSPATDIYALGATLYRMLTGTLPPESQALVTDLAELVPPRKINPAISINVEKAILKAMALKRKERFQSCADFVVNLNLSGFKNLTGLDNKDEPTQIENEDHHWRNTTKTDTVTAYKNYLATYTKGKYATHAKKRIAEIEEPTIINNNDNFAKVETDIWEKIKSSTNIDDFKNYLQKYPNGKYTTEAKKRIGQIIAGQKSDKPDNKPVRFKTPLIIAIAVIAIIITLFIWKPWENNSQTEAVIDNSQTEAVNDNSQTETVTDIDGNTYKTIKIGTQTWMVENLRTTKYNDGTAIPNVTDNDQWANLTTGAYCWYDNNTENKNKYGALYNWYAVDTKKLAPEGWHVPTDAEWTTLINYLGGESTAGGKMKATTGWNSPNTGASNSSGFSAFPSGYRYASNGTFYYAGSGGDWWSRAADGSSDAWYRYLDYDSAEAGRYNGNRRNGFAVRCLKD